MKKIAASFVLLVLSALFTLVSIKAEEAKQILETRWNGNLGLFYTIANESLAGDLKIKNRSFLVTGVMKGSSAEKGGVKRGDIVLEASSNVWNTEGVSGSLKILRKDGEQTVNITTTKHTLKNIQLVMEKTPDIKPKNIVVDASGSGDFLTITGALIQANPGDTIFINNGVYSEGVILISGIKIKAKEKGGAKIEAAAPLKIAGVEDVSIEGVALEGTAAFWGAKNVLIDGLSITSEKGTSIYIEDSRDVNIKESILMGKEKTTGIKLENSQAKILNNIISGYSQGILVAFSSEAEISGNLLDNNASAIFVIDSKISANKNNITGTGSDSGIWLKKSNGTLTENFIRRQKTAIWGSLANGSITGNLISQNDYGIVLLSGSINISRNTILNNKSYGIWLSGEKTTKETIKNIAISGNTISGNGGTGIYATDFTTDIKYNLLEGNWNGILVEHGASTIQNNTIVLQKSTGVWLDSNSKADLYNNIITHNTFGIRSNPGVTLKTSFNNVCWNFARKEFPLRDGNFAREDWLLTKGGERIRILVYPAYDLKGGTDIAEDPGFVKLGKDHRLMLNSSLAKKKGKDNSFIGAFPPFKK